MTYRPDIDGLRAIAVLGVVAYHLHLPLLAGGYMGVDVFFVISGYLITSILVARTFDGGQPLSGFYVARVRRIAPVMLLATAVTLSLGYFWKLPEDFAALGESAAATVLFVSNMHFYASVDYFDTSSEVNPLLHTWSLAVEEQFYIVLPLALLLLWRRPALLKPALWSAIALSFLCSVWLVERSPPAAFYLLPSRAWELLIGSALALGHFPAVHRPGARTAAAALGAGSILAAFVLFDEHTPFPGASALPAVLGTVLIILSGERSGGADAPERPSPIHRWLAWRPMVLVGLLSYSIYVWHWPIIVYAENLLPGPIDGALAQVALILAVAWLSWRYVERPFRTRSGALFSPRPLVNFSAVGLVSAAILAVALLVISQEGLPGRLPAEVKAYADDRLDFSPRREECHLGLRGDIDTFEPCVHGSGEEALVVWGDSHGVELAFALAESPERAMRVTQLTASSCPPALEFETSGNPDCAAVNEAFLARATAPAAPRDVLLVAFYRPHLADSLDALFAGLERTAGALRAAGKRVSVLAPVPYPGRNVPRESAYALMRGESPRTLDVPLERHVREYAAIRERLFRLAIVQDVRIVDPVDVLCDERVCEVAPEDGTLFFDAHHLSNRGAAQLAELWTLPPLL